MIYLRFPLLKVPEKYADIQKILQPITAEHVFFLRIHEIFFRIDHNYKVCSRVFLQWKTALAYRRVFSCKCSEWCPLPLHVHQCGSPWFLYSWNPSNHQCFPQPFLIVTVISKTLLHFKIFFLVLMLQQCLWGWKTKYMLSQTLENWRVT